MKTMHLFSGIGGGLLCDLILGHDPIIAVEWDRYCCQVLRERASEGWFPNLHVWEGDVRLFDPSPWKGRVDCIAAGFPCQDISCAGKQAGLEGETRSGLYREVLRIASTVRPQYIFLENVSAILSNGLGCVLGDLAKMGMDARWCCLRASSVGAQHRRDRWWCLAYAKGFNALEQTLETPDSTTYESRRVAFNVSREIRPLGREADKPSMVGTSYDLAHWVDRSKAIGNGQVPLQAATAWCLLGGPVNL